MTDKGRKPIEKLGKVGFVCFYSYVIRDIYSEKITVIEKLVHIMEVDVVGIDMVIAFPAGRPNGVIRFSAHVPLGCTDNGVLAVRFIPDYGQFNPSRFCLANRPKLGTAL
jgi:uncharacterized protein (UPF0210 family)